MSELDDNAHSIMEYIFEEDVQDWFPADAFGNDDYIFQHTCHKKI